MLGLVNLLFGDNFKLTIYLNGLRILFKYGFVEYYIYNMIVLYFNIANACINL